MLGDVKVMLVLSVELGAPLRPRGAESSEPQLNTQGLTRAGAMTATWSQIWIPAPYSTGNAKFSFSGLNVQDLQFNGTPLSSTSFRSTPVSSISTPESATFVSDGSPVDGYTDGETAGSARLNNFSTGDVAVVGLACRVAGGNDSPEKLFESLLNQQDASGEIPPMRWEPYYRRDARNKKSLSKTTSRGYFLDKLEDFDSSFFGISPKEAELMDPQQRVSLEVTWEALESAGIPPQSLNGSNTAVFMGVNSDDYSKLLLEDLPGVEAWMGIGTAYCGVPNRISYLLNLMGPSTAVDAACASSLVAIHHGRQALLAGESNVAIAGGSRAISQEGNCKSFDAAASGYGRGEGAGVVILKRMEDAVKDNDRIFSVLKGTAVAQDGRTNGIMAPNGSAQELVAKNALREANVDPRTIAYVEAHATSTSVGDPVEATAMSNIYGKDRPGSDRCMIGSIKPNVGHLGAGAGAMGFMKAVLAINNSVVPPQTNLKTLNDRVNWEESGLKVVQTTTEWPSSTQPRRAGVSSYGYGGSVSHAVLEAAPTELQARKDLKSAPSDVGAILTLPAPQEKRLKSAAQALSTWMGTDGSKNTLDEIPATLGSRRNHHTYRAAVVADSHEGAASSTAALSKGTEDAWTVTGKVVGNGVNQGAVWVFSGHGSQWKNMGQELLANEPAFVDGIAEVARVIVQKMGFSAYDALQRGNFEASDRVQILTYTMQVGLASVLRSKGLKPDAIIGHSVGEIAASVVAGALTPAEGGIVVCRRARLYRKVMGLGAMVMVNSPFEQIRIDIGSRDDIAAAIDSSPSSCVVSGTSKIVEQFAEGWKAKGIKVMRVKTDIAFHSPVLNDLVAPLSKELIKTLSPRLPKVALYSTSLDDIRGENLRDVAYWVGNMIKPVRLTEATKAAAADGFRVFLEVSAHPVVSQSVDETLLESDIEDHAMIPTMLRDKPVRKNLLLSIAKLYCKGVPISWRELLPVDWAFDVPKQIWNHQPYWRQVGTASASADLNHDVSKHTLLGQRIPIAGNSALVYRTTLDEETKPFPGNHPLHGTEIVPAAVLLNTFFSGTGAHSLHNVILRVPVAISAPRELQVISQQNQVQITSRLLQAKENHQDDQSWLTHTTARFSDQRSKTRYQIDIEATKARISTKLDTDFSIKYLERVGVPAMGFPWAVTEHFGNNKEMLPRVDVAPAVSAGSALEWDESSWAPVLDAATSIGSTLFHSDPRLRMPAQIDQAMIHDGATPPKVGYVYVEEATDTELAVNVTVVDENGVPLVEFRSIHFSEIEGTPGASGSVESLVHQLDYVEELSRLKIHTTVVSSPKELSGLSGDKMDESVLVHVPDRVESNEVIPRATEIFCEQLLDTVKFVASQRSSANLGASPTALAHAPLLGLGRIIASEQPDLWGAVIDVESTSFPLQAIKYVQGVDVIKIDDTIARRGLLRPLPREKRLLSDRQMRLFPRPEGTYLITGGLGALGVEVASFLADKGARRIVLASRRGLPPRSLDTRF
ncbi:MAG: Type I Iterative PKS [Sclerophora amabilis]|nr:MAG: Type I Iterative PKS [Sclerophora amabilis]